MRFYMLMGGQRKGPFAIEQLAAEGLERDTLVWHTGQADWVRADQLPALDELMLTIPPPVPRPPAPASQDPPPAPPPPASPEEQAFLASWVRYRPGVFKTLYAWFLVSLGLSFLVAVGAVVFFILAENERHAAYEAQVELNNPVVFRDIVNREAHRARINASWRRVNNFILFDFLSVALAALTLVGALVLFYVLLYKAWNQIQDGHARTSAGKAVGFLFIPFFNLYWLFVAIYGLAWDLHNYVARRRLYGRHNLLPYPVSPGLGLACCILMICNLIPFLNFVTVPATLIVLVIWLGAVRSASANIAAARLAEATWAPEPVVVPVPAEKSPTGKSEYVRRLDGEAAGPKPEERAAGPEER
jgi:hypothetical protein